MHRPSSIRAADQLSLIALASLAAVALLRAHDRAVALAAGLVAAVVVGLAVTAARSAAWRVAHDFSPILVIVVAFELAGPIIAVANPARWDTALAAADAAHFARLSNGWRHTLGRPAWLTDLAYVAYVSFYVVPIAVAAALYAKGRRAAFARFTTFVEATFFASYVGYFLFPTTGPRVAAEHAASVLGGSAVSDAIRAFLGVVELNVLDAFPSGHTAITLVTVALGARFLPRMRAPLVAWACAIVFATVYLSYHYVVDVIAGAALAAAVLLVERAKLATRVQAVRRHALRQTTRI